MKMNNSLIDQMDSLVLLDAGPHDTITETSPNRCPAPDQQTRPDAEWEFLLDRTTLYATGHVNRWFWRGSDGGVLPDGFDARSLAAEAIAGFLQDSANNPYLHSLSATQVQRNLERRVRTLVNRLHHRSENRLVRNEPDLAPVTLDDGEAISIIELIPEPARKPDEALLEKESLTRFRRFKFRFSRFLGGNRRLLRLFELFCDDHSGTADLASNMKLHPSAVKNLRLRFLNQWNQFHGRSFSANHPSKIKNL